MHTPEAKGDSLTYLVDPASSICLFQSLSHACLSTVVFTRRYRGRLIKSVVVQMGPSSRYNWITVVILELIHATHIPRCESTDGSTY